MKNVQSLRNAVMVSLLAGTTLVWMGRHRFCAGGFAGVHTGGYGGNGQPCTDTKG